MSGQPVRRRGRLRPRIAAQLVSTAIHVSDRTGTVVDEWWDRQDAAATVTDDDVDVDVDVANHNARFLRRVENAGRVALRARTQRGQIAAWSTVLELPADFIDAQDQLEHYATRHSEELRATRDEVQPVIDHLNAAQRSATSWELPPVPLARRGCWAGRDHWVEHADACLDALRSSVDFGISPHNVRALVRAVADFFDPSGHGCTASAATVVSTARERHGATIAESTGKRRLSTIVRILTEKSFLRPQARGRYLTSIERMAARCHHGRAQHRAANHLDADLPRHLRPAGTPPPPAPAWAASFGARIADGHCSSLLPSTGDPVADRVAMLKHTLNCRNQETSTYSGGYRRFSDARGNLVTHSRAHAPADTDFPSSSPNTTFPTSSEPASPPPGKDKKGVESTISLRARRIADDLTRHDPEQTLATGPYAHLLTCGNGTLSLNGLARLIDRMTPTWAGTRDVLAGLVHAATSPTTGHVALGTRTRPDNPAAWMTRVLARIDWDDPDAFPPRSIVDDAFGLTWCGPRREWTNVG
ncbi:hypothetical protein [Corynebacterium kalidii]